MAFNPITLEYEKSESGKILAQKDDEAKVRELIRKGNLDARSNCGYNVITGISINHYYYFYYHIIIIIIIFINVIYLFLGETR